MSPNEIQLICDRLDRIEDKLDEYTRCQANKVPRSECNDHRKSLWNIVNGLSHKVWIAVGIGIAVQLFVVPVLIWLITRG